jgi:hypothetical protein
VGVALYLFVFDDSSESNNNDNSSEAVTTSMPNSFDEKDTPTPAPSMISDSSQRSVAMRDALFPLAGTSLFNQATPQWKALNWLVEDDGAQLEPRPSTLPIIRERFALAVFYFSTNGETWGPRVSFLTEASVCDWQSLTEGVTCNSDGFVEEITLGVYIISPQREHLFRFFVVFQALRVCLLTVLLLCYE